MNTPLATSIDRRSAIKWVLAATATLTVFDRFSRSADTVPPTTAKGYGPDPDLMKAYLPGDLWPLTFTPQQRRLAITLCDLMIPADDNSPKASDLKVHDFIDEWISSPYPGQAGDRKTILEGMTWIDAESSRRYGGPFASAKGPP